MNKTCPICGAEQDPDEHDVGWYFLCCKCMYLLVWTEEGTIDLVEPDDE